MRDPAAVRVLVVDGDEELPPVVEAVLEAAAPAGTEVWVEHAASLTDAAHRLTEGPAPSAVLVDLALPDVPGGATPVAGVAVLATVPEAPPLIAISSSATDRSREAVAAGASDYLSKEELERPNRCWRAVVLAMERHRRGRELAEQGSELVRATTQLAHLSARLRHDLRAPLAVAIAALETISQVDLEGETRADLHGMVMQRLRDLSDRLDDLSRTLTAGELGEGPTRERVDVPALLEEVRADLAPWDRARLRLEQRGAEQLWAARRLLRGLLGGLVRNALQHNPDGEVTITVEVRLEEGRAVLLVADDGIEIAPELRDAVFDVGWTSDGQPSSAVGLAAANSAVAMMEGRIRAVDSPHGGTAFRIELPQRPARTAAPV